MHICFEGIVFMKKTMVAKGLFFLIIAAALLSFFIVAHPLYIYDVDDWTAVTRSRHAVPMTGEWNPTRILPETIMPLSALIGVDVIMPFTGDYIHSIGVAFAIVLVLFILYYLFNFGKAIKRIFDLKEGAVIFLTTAFLSTHFVVYKSKLSGTPHMLYGGNTVGYFFYIIPGLLNAALVMWLMERNVRGVRSAPKKNSVYMGMLILAFYLALNSNLFQSIILASFAAANMLRALIKSDLWRKDRKDEPRKKKIWQFVKQNAIWEGIIAAWLIVHLFEMKGGRANMIYSYTEGFPISETIKNLLSSFSSIKVTFVLCTFGLIGIALTTWLIRRIKRNKVEEDQLDQRFGSFLFLMLVSLFITLVYLILLCTKVNPGYISNSNVQISFLFWVVFIAFLCFGYIAARYPKVVAILPLFVFIMTFETVVCSGKYADPYMDTATVKALDENIIRQVKEAEKKGLSSVDVLVPEHPSPGWPLAVDIGGERIGYSLYKHGIIRTNMKITLVPSAQINAKFGLDITE